TQPGSPGLAAIPARPKHDCKAEERPPRRVLQAFADHLGEGPERQVLRLLGLFDRPAPSDELQALRAPPAIAGLTDRLEPPGAWEAALTRLRALGLIAQAPAPNSPAAGSLDAHPLIRTHFADDLPAAAAQAGHDRLYRHLIAKPAKDQPDTLADLHPLYLAIPHGVAAGHAQEVLDEVYLRRIRRGEQMYSLKKLGAYGASLAALAAFFDPPWSQPLSELTGGDRAFLLNEAGLCLRALGRLAEAVELYRVGREMRIQQQRWNNASAQAGNLSEVLVALGRLPEAVAAGRQAVDLADRSGDASERIDDRTIFADALHQSGDAVEARRWIVEAEAIQRKWQPAYPLLYSLQGFRYGDLLLGQGEAGEMRRRAAQTLEWVTRFADPLSIALNHLSLGRAEAAVGKVRAAADSLERAVDGLRRAGDQDMLALGLLARAAFRRGQGQFDKAERDLAEVRRIAGRGGMRLHLIDAELEEVRLRRAEGRAEDPEALGRIRAAIAETGYHRRDRELEELEATVTPR
ncbi:MAG: tetratricopeptide repeat protein, partial [Rhodospirillaceae bacterium]